MYECDSLVNPHDRWAAMKGVSFMNVNGGVYWRMCRVQWIDTSVTLYIWSRPGDEAVANNDCNNYEGRVYPDGIFVGWYPDPRS